MDLQMVLEWQISLRACPCKPSILDHPFYPPLGFKGPCLGLKNQAPIHVDSLYIRVFLSLLPPIGTE